MAKALKAKFPSELRSDPLSQDWVIIATGRGKRPETFQKERRKGIIPSKKNCPFCFTEKEKPLLVFANGQKAVPNKYPALVPSDSLGEESEGPYYKKMKGVGFHEVIVTRDHLKSLALLPLDHVIEVINVYQERYLDLMNEPFVKYISIFHNHGEEAGASIFHPHSQIIATPVIDPDLNRALSMSENYFKKTDKCVYCEISDWDRKDRKRIVFENKGFVVICPFASKAAFELIISPKEHSPYFERISDNEKKYLAEALQVSLRKLYKGLNDPPYNFYLHTAPPDGKNYSFYHWHMTIVPKTATWAGFELSTGIEISTIEPERAADYLKKQSYDL
ncbi:MAG: galactose-1-phosphate uridylyltransferase [Candidatus Nealsonbacteria bacterium]|nr:galactose-1-phosphate uridylyltransferase [Candidatus Nealsonbacteria bacterium]